MMWTSYVALMIMYIRSQPTWCFKFPLTAQFSRPSMRLHNDSSSEDLNMDILRRRMEQQDTQYARLLMEQTKYFGSDGGDDLNEEIINQLLKEKRRIPESVHIILFQPDTPQQHVHTIEFPKDSGNNIILAFEDGADCRKFALQLRELEFLDPAPEETDFEPLAQHCQSIGMHVAIVPTGFDISPPQLNSNDEVEMNEECDDEGENVNESGAKTYTNSLEQSDIDLNAWG
mmetsp:Transcript_16204/g.33912  ORF Transcript_16204/g.33912 Transcript_16204/m.33912 type:complete len:230 (+) Transcript_16204:91-780(+)